MVTWRSHTYSDILDPRSFVWRVQSCCRRAPRRLRDTVVLSIVTTTHSCINMINNKANRAGILSRAAASVRVFAFCAWPIVSRA